MCILLRSTCSCFKFSIGNKVYQFTNDLWKTLFRITVGDADADDEVDPLVTDLYTHVNFNCSFHLKMVARILLSVVSHILQPKNDGCLRIDNSKIHLVYILLYKVKINWPHYFVSRMFSIKNFNKGTSFCYPSMIAKILNYFDIDLPNLTYKSLGLSQEFSHCALVNMN